MNFKILLFICFILSILLIFMQVKIMKNEEISNNKMKQSEEILKSKKEEELKKDLYLKEKNDLFNFLLKKESSSTIDVFFRSNEEFNVFNFETMEISNFTIQPFILSKQINPVYLDKEFFRTMSYEPIILNEKISFKKEHFNKNYTNNYEAISDCGASASFNVVFILTLSFDENAQLFIKESKKEDYLMGFDKCGFNAEGYDKEGFGEKLK